MSTTQSTYIIAEMACSHDGDLSKATKIIDSASTSGANAIQFQVWTRDAMLTPNHPDHDFLGQLELSREGWAQLANHVRSKPQPMEIIACVYELGSLAFCQDIGVDAFKIHAADVRNLAFLEDVGKTGKRVDLSIGACLIQEIEAAIETLRQNGCPEIWLMYGLQNFPTPAEDIDLKLMMNLGQIFGVRVGYQDHSDPESHEAYSLPAAAMGLGATIIEKHITHDRSLKGADYQAALNADEFDQFTTMVRNIDQALSGGVLAPLTPAEEKYRAYSTKSIVTTKPVVAGDALTKDNTMILRSPTPGLPSNLYKETIGKTFAIAKDAFEPVQASDLN